MLFFFPIVSLFGCASVPANPPVVTEPAWDSPRTRDLVRRACFDCHSNETVWPFYARVPGIDKRIREHVAEGRRVLNFSEWHRPQEGADDVVEVVLRGDMPPEDYLQLHPGAKMEGSDRRALMAGLRNTVLRARKDD